MYKCPIEFYTKNIIFNSDGSGWGAFKLTGIDYDFLNDEAKLGMLFKTGRFLAGITSDVQILVLPINQDIESHYRQLKRDLDTTDPLYDTAVSYTEQTEQYLQDKGLESDSNDYRTYIFAKMDGAAGGDIVSSARHALQFFIADPINAINVQLATDAKEILMSRVERLQESAESWFFTQNQKLALTEVQGEELQWIFRRMAYRGLKSEVALFYKDTHKGVWQPRYQLSAAGKESVIKPWGRDIVNLFSGTMTSRDRVVKIEHERMSSYQTFLAVTGLPEELDFPGNEWLYMLQRDNQQAEICIHIKATENKAALRKIEMKKREINSQVENVEKAGAEIPDDLAAGGDYAAILENEIKTNKDPLLETTITICVAAEDIKKLEEQTVTIREKYQDMNFIIERPIADQIKLYMSFIPTVGITVKDYVMPLTPTTLASGVIGVSRELGDGKGGYIGTTGAEEKNVYLNMGLACLQNKSASATFFGNLGFGKSFNANLLVFLTVLYGGYGLIFDPKGERSHWEQEFSMLRGYISTVTLSAGSENTGMLDPYNIYRDDIDEANELALNILTEMFKLSPNSMEYTAILEAIGKMEGYITEEKKASMLRLAELLDAFDAEDELCKPAKMIARRIRLHRTAGMARLLMGEGGEPTISLDNRLNILQIQNLKLPSPETPKADYTSEENISTVVMMVLSHFAKKFALIPRNVFSVILFDESWALGKTAEGVKMYDFLTRMGRSLYTGCIFNGHSVLDLPTEAIKNTITYKFCFCTTNENEAVRMCEYLGLEATPQNMATIMNLKNGECMFQDMEKHVGILRFDAIYQDIIDVFSTTPKTKQEKTAAETEDKPAEAEDVAAEAEITLEERMRQYEQETGAGLELDFDFSGQETKEDAKESLQEVEPLQQEALGEATQEEIPEEVLPEKESELDDVDYDKIMQNLMKREVV